MDEKKKCKGCGRFLGRGPHHCPQGIMRALEKNPLLGELADGHIFNEIAEELEEQQLPHIATSAPPVPRSGRIRKMPDPDT